ncbi:hypothetical protein NAP1_10148 [Erythrobacter sp. NAP1]|uniref:COG3650 family protein n=1 Tax=Erythrobacter sp. NAP1 TaxID=237727 RepID=UPI000068789F|nr:hypothetical protein [Erythrobacter sp. NAP1]EAQ27947.1 hypothetical protein NAP1_10148 [Erythrobacter sp. NAP1]
MIARPIQLAVLALPLALAACSDVPGEITRDTEPFAGIAPEETLTALGNEPFWNVKVEPAGEGGFIATYSTPENIEGREFAVSRFAGNNGIGMSGELDGAPASLALTPGECSDTMSDRIYPYTATFALGDETYFGCAYTSAQPYIGEQMP